MPSSAFLPGGFVLHPFPWRRGVFPFFGPCEALSAAQRRGVGSHLLNSVNCVNLMGAAALERGVAP